MLIFLRRTNTTLYYVRLVLLMLSEFSSILASKDTQDDYDDAPPEKSSQVEVRAVFIDCEPAEGQSASDSEMTRFQRQELFKHNALRDCNKKLALTVKVSSEPNKNPGDEYIPIDHVFEGANRKRVRLVNPYILRLLRESPLQAYMLHRTDTVSGVLTQSDPGKLEEIHKKRSRIQRDVDHISEADEWSQVLGSAASMFTLDHDEPGRQSYSVRVGNLKDLVQDTETTTRTDTQISRDCGLSLFNESTTKAKQGTGTTIQRHPIFEQRKLGSNPKKPLKPKIEICLKDNLTVIREKRHKQILLAEEPVRHKVPQRITKNHFIQRMDQDRDIPEPLEMTNDIYNSMHDEELDRSSDSKKQYLQSEPDLTGSVSHEAAYESEKRHKNKDNIKTEKDFNQKVDNIKDRSIYKYPDKSSDESNTDYKSDFDSSGRDFALYEIGSPNLWYTVHVQLFEKLSTPEGKTVWNDVTKGEQARDGADIERKRMALSIRANMIARKFARGSKEVKLTLFRAYCSVSSTHPEWLGQDMSLRYRPAEWVSRDDYTLPVASLCLLEPLHDSNPNMSEDDSNPDKNNNQAYIVVPIEDVVGLDTEKNLDKRNGENNQNFSSTSSSNDELQQRRRVEVRVSRALFGGSGDSFNIATEGPDRFLTLPHRRPHHAQIDLEVRADDNELVRVGSSGRIATVVADNTRISRSIITLQATNTGLASARFRVMARDCGPELSGLINEKGSEGTVAGPVLLPPKHTRRLRLELPIEIPVDVAHCSVALVNDNDEAVAVRDVVIKKGDRCFCVWHCDCVCLSDDPKLICRAMPPSAQAAAGLSAHERSRHARSCCYDDNITLNMTIIIIGVIVTLLLLGIIKACLGLECRCVSSWGLSRLLQMPRKLGHYHERNLRNYPVEYDSDGWPVHPETKERTVRLFSRPVEFLLNLIFFLTLPCLLLCEALRWTMASLVKRYHSKKCQLNEVSNHGTKECFSSQDIQSVAESRRRRRGSLRRWMTPPAEQLSADIWHDGLTPNTNQKCETMQPLLYETRPQKLGETPAPASCGDSEQDDTEYVLTQMQKSRESLARSQRKPNDSGVSTARNLWKGDPMQSKR